MSVGYIHTRIVSTVLNSLRRRLHTIVKMSAPVLKLDSTVALSTGYVMPLLGFGVYQNYSATESCLEAFKAGYRKVSLVRSEGTCTLIREDRHDHYRHIDSAQAYRNEAQVGVAVKGSGLKREDIFITTKCVSRTHGYHSTLKGVDESLERFGVDYIDLFLIHNPHSGKKLRLETYKALQEARQARKVRTVGVSNYGVHHLEEIREAGYETPSINQIELHPLCQQKPIVEYCREHGIVVQAYSPIVQGNLSHPVFHEIAQKHKKDAAQVLIRWSLQKGFVPLPKSARTERIHSNAQVYDFSLDEEDMTKLDSLDKGAAGAVTWNPVDVE